ncbi:MAG: FHA domain-containing protein [Acidimicrobiales bacterium]
MPEQLLNLLKLCLLALLYLFFLRVARAVWVEVGGPRVRRRGGDGHGPAGAPTADLASAGTSGPPTLNGDATVAVTHAPAFVRPAHAPPAPGPELLTIAPQEAAGRRYPLTGELTIGRASGCGVLLEDTYVSQLHARVFVQPDGVYVEDLGSTNGTYLLRDRDRQQERHKVAGPRLLERGDQVQVGSTVMELVA